jgi:hypothetical protein
MTAAQAAQAEVAAAAAAPPGAVAARTPEAQQRSAWAGLQATMCLPAGLWDSGCAICGVIWSMRGKELHETSCSIMPSICFFDAAGNPQVGAHFANAADHLRWPSPS